MKTRSPRRAAALLLALALACSLLTIPAAGAAATTPPVATVQLERGKKAAPCSMEEGDTALFSLDIPPEDADKYKPSDITWQILSGNSYVSISPSSDRLTATVTAGSLGAVTSGKAEIRAVIEGGGVYGPCEITVKRKTVEITGATLDKTWIGSDGKFLTGDTEKLTVTLQPRNATLDDIEGIKDKKVSWISSKPSIVSVEGDGLTAKLTAKNKGTAEVTFSFTTKDPLTGEIKPWSQTCTVDVTQRPDISSLTVRPTNLALTRTGDTAAAEFTVTVKGGAVTGEAANDIIVDPPYYNSDTNTVSPVSSVSPIISSDKSVPYEATYTYRVTARPNAALNSQATITIKAKSDPSKSGACIVTITSDPTPKVDSVTISGSSQVRYVDPLATIQLTASAEPATATASDREITWKSSEEKIADVDPKTGPITTVTGGQQPGKATITASTNNGKYDTQEIETSGVLLSYRPSGETAAKSLTESSVVDIYQYHDLTVLTELFGNAKGKGVTLSTSNTSVASVDDSLRVTGTYPGESTITATVTGTSFTAKFKVRVSEDTADAVTVSMGANASYSFSGLLSELDKRSQDKAGGPLESVSSLKVSTQNGTLYYGYSSANNPGHGVGGTERFYYQPAGQGQLAIRDVTFVPLPGFDGTAVVDYTATATNGTTFNGTIRITATASGDVAYSTEINQPIAFAAEHFSAVCMGRNGQSVRYINFSQPDAGRGTLYYNYSPTGQYSPKVVNSTAYYVSGSPSINGITFVPAENFAGTVNIPYRCIDSSGASYTGTVTVTVRSANGSTSGDVEYSIARNQRQTFRASDFSSACQRAIGGTLDYIRFTDLPSSAAGILYQNYTSSSSTRVPTGRSYYRNSSPYISDISFVPAANYSGTVTIPFTAANTSGDTFSGTLVIHVDDGVGTVHYSTPRNQAVTFASADFNDASRRINGATLNYIRFTALPRSSAGTLYLNYTSSSSTRVSTGTNYYRSGSPALSNVTFVPASGYEGTVTIPFTAYDDNGSSFDGTVTVAVGSAGQTVYYATVPRGSVRFNGADFNSACRFATGDSLSYVRFNLPSSTYGTLYYQYNSSTRTGSGVAASTNYYYSGSGSHLIGDVSFAASSATGTVTFGYTGYSAGGSSFSGTVEIRISSSAVIGTSIRYAGSSAPIAFRASDFQNLCQMTLGYPLSYVQFTSLPAVGQLSQNYSGPAQTGTGVNTFTHYGTQDLDQISYLPKAEYQGTIYIPYTLYDTQGAGHSSSVEIQVSNDYNYSSFSDISSGYWASPSIEFLRASGITNGYGNNTYRPAQSISRGEFTLMICRAFQFPTTGSSGFPDVPANSTYAGAVASARELGIVEGNNGLFQPDRPITRQSAMTMICRAMDAAGQAVPSADVGLLSSYADGGRVSAFARSSVASLIQMGVVRGNNSNMLNPTAAISRAEMAVILHRVLTR